VIEKRKKNKDYFLLPTGLVIMEYKDYFLLPTGLDYKQYGNLLSSLQKFYGRQHKLVDHYEILPIFLSR
jgi:hypothetical protein